VVKVPLAGGKEASFASIKGAAKAIGKAFPKKINILKNTNFIITPQNYKKLLLC
jgi:hypothetical protein